MADLTTPVPLPCPRRDCLNPLTELTVSSEPEGIRRDRVCTYCHSYFAVAKSGFIDLTRRSHAPPAPEGTQQRIAKIAEFLKSYARDEGGFSDETRADIQADARFLLDLVAAPVPPEGITQQRDTERRGHWLSGFASAYANAERGTPWSRELADDCYRTMFPAVAAPVPESPPTAPDEAYGGLANHLFGPASVPESREDGEAAPWTGSWNNWIAPFHVCPRCRASLNWQQGEDVLDRPWLSARCCGLTFSAPLAWSLNRNPKGQQP